MPGAEIPVLHIARSFILVIPAIIILIYYKTGQPPAAIKSLVRMVIQLVLSGVFLEYLFRYDHPVLNMAWVAMIALVGGYTITERVDLQWRLFTLPLFFSFLLSIMFPAFFLIWFVLPGENLFPAQMMVPVFGMIAGNTLKNNIIALEEFLYRITENRLEYLYSLSMGLSPVDARWPFASKAIKSSVNPTIAMLATTGLIAIPGMMTGQILAGSPPLVAIGYQIVIMAAIFSSGVIGVALCLKITETIAFDRDGMIRQKIWLKRK